MVNLDSNGFLAIWGRIVILWGALSGIGGVGFSQEAEEEPDIFPVHVVYFTPSDEEPAPDAAERLARVMGDIQEFYRSEMVRNGYGPLTFSLDRVAPDRIRIHYVRGVRKRDEYGPGDYEAIRREVAEALFQEEPSGDSTSRKRIFLDQSTVVIFQKLLDRHNGEIIQRGPFVGSGNHRFGVAFVFDDPRLDPDLLASNAPLDPDGTKSLTEGDFNSRYLGGLAHELGHAFGLNHNAETKAEKARGEISLMGIGNNVYGKRRRGGDEDAILTAGDALRLSRCLAFRGESRFSRVRPRWRFLTLDGSFQDRDDETVLELSGRIESNLPLSGIIAYNDDLSIPGDYDAVGFSTIPETDGAFHLTISDLVEGDYQLKLLPVFETGASDAIMIPYSIDSEFSSAGLNRLHSFTTESLLKRLFQIWNPEKLEEVVLELKRRGGTVDPDLIRKGELLHRLMTAPVEPVPPSAVPDEETSFDLSDAQWRIAKVGFDRPCRRIVPQDLFLSVGRQFYDSGLFAHAPSRYQFALGGRWETLTIGYGIADGHFGTVVFAIYGDKEEIFRSEPIRDNQLRTVTIPVHNVDLLDLTVFPTQDGKSQDWGVWIDPILTRGGGSRLAPSRDSDPLEEPRTE